MISKDELARAKEKRKTTLYYEEKEYLQYIFLHAISKFADSFAFKGGTCLRICYGLERASEDLDFSTTLSIKKIESIILEIIKEYELRNIALESKEKKEFKGNARFELRFRGPLYSGSAASTNTLKIDFNKTKARRTSARVISQLFSDVPFFTLVALDEKELLAEKIRSLVRRKEPRDLYDVWVLISRKIQLDKKFLDLKLKEEKASLLKLDFPTEKEYNRDLKNLLFVLPDYNQVCKEVEEYLLKFESRRIKYAGKKI
ncbi:nucleotidyl transferase AbiEii/AbiGii toxin family protein [Candidatus Pacearchaeota archaeon]|nr:nucleotidyl transferase AbiEii/AbiGii toxin family protein [Candidatus Pacearchaeota archaeon]